MRMEANHCPVAIVGMSCFFPKSIGLKAYWRLLLNGQDAITEVPPTHWSTQDYYDPDPHRPDHVHCSRGGFLSPVSFDPSEFGIPPSTLEATDTSQLLALAAARQAIEDVGLPFDRSRTSVVLGVSGTQELVIPLGARLGHPHWRRALADAGVAPALAEQIVARIAEAYVPWQENSFPGLLGNVVAGRISNRLDLGGTNCVVDAACASSMAAVYLAMIELAAGRSDTVITGGVDTLNDIFMHMCFAKTQALSSSGDARPFSKNADGTVLGEGLGLLVLKRLPDAERDGNRIYAVIQGIGSSSDGRSQSIYAPRVEGQAKALEAAYASAGIDPATVALIEAHGTGTRIGDKVEFQALCQVLGKTAGKSNRCALGSVKSMIGHTKAAAGSAGLVKAALALHHKVLLPTLKADEPDPALNIEESPFYLNTRSRPWFAAKDHPRRAGVSSFGFGGSNFHVILEEYRPEKTQAAWDGSVQILAFSADDLQGLSAAMDGFKALAGSPLADAVFAAEAARTRSRFSPSHRCRLLVVVDDPAAVSDELDQALQALGSRSNQGFFKLPHVFFGGPAPPEKLAFLFPGQGSQYAGMGRDIACLFPAAMAVLETANRRFDGDRLLSDFIHPRPGLDPAAAEIALRATNVAQPAIGAVSLALLRSLQEFGLAPDAVGGHSFGELTALCAAGWIDEGTFLDLAIARGKAMAGAGTEEQGAMLAVRAPLAEIEALFKRNQLDVVLANRNGPAQAYPVGPAQCDCRGRPAVPRQRLVRQGLAGRRRLSQPADARGPGGVLKERSGGTHRADAGHRVFQQHGLPLPCGSRSRPAGARRTPAPASRFRRRDRGHVSGRCAHLSRNRPQARPVGPGRIYPEGAAVPGHRRRCIGRTTPRHAGSGQSRLPSGRTGLPGAAFELGIPRPRAQAPAHAGPHQRSQLPQPQAAEGALPAGSGFRRQKRPTETRRRPAARAGPQPAGGICPS